MKRRGAALLHVIVLGIVILGIATAVIRWQLQRHHQSAGNLRNSRSAGEASGLSNSISACLAASGYPSGSCSPTAAQAACVPAGEIVVFSGVPPACKFTISAAR